MIGTRQQLSKVEEEALLVCGQSVIWCRWWRYMISVSSSTGRLLWRLTWAILCVAACINSANSTALSGCWPSTPGALLPQHLLLLVALTTATVFYIVLWKEKFSDFKWFRTLLPDLLLVRESSASVTPILQDVLHWLSVQHQVSYKIAILARDCIHSIGPAYLGDVYAPVTTVPGRSNLFYLCGNLLIPRTRTKLGERSFRISAPTAWNSLPYPLKHSAACRKHFRKELKISMFRNASQNYWRVNLLIYLPVDQL